MLRLLLLFAFFLTVNHSFSATFYSRLTGSWNVSTNWSNVSHVGAPATGTPGPADDVIIGDGHIISMSGGPTFNCNNLTVNDFPATGATLSMLSGSYTLQVGGNVSGNGAIIMSGGGSIALTISGDNTHTGTFNPGGSITVNYNGTGTQQVRGGTYYNLIISPGATKTLTGNATVNGYFTLNSGTSTAFQLGPAVTTFQVMGTTSLLGTNSTFLFGGTSAKTVTLTGDMLGNGAIDMQVALPHILILSGAINNDINFYPAFGVGQKVIYNNVSVPQQVFSTFNYDNLEIQALDARINGSSDIWVRNNLTVTAGSSFTAGTYNIQVDGNWINNGTFVTTGSVTFKGFAISTIGGISPTDFNVLNIDKSPPGLVKANQQINNTTSTFINAGNTLDLGQNITNHNLGAVSGTGILALSAPNAGTTTFPNGNFTNFLAPTGTGIVEYNNSTSYNISHAAFPAGLNYFDVIISGGGNKTYSIPYVTIENNLSIAPATSLGTSGPGAWQITGDVINNGSFFPGITTLAILSDYISFGGSMMSHAGQVFIGGNLNNGGTFLGTGGSAALTFDGIGNQVVSGNLVDARQFVLNKPSGGDVVLDGDVTVKGNFDLVTDGLVTTNNGNLILEQTSAIIPQSFSGSRMIQTTGSGLLKLAGSIDSDFLGTYPIGVAGVYTPFNLTAFTSNISAQSYIDVKAVNYLSPPPANYVGKFISLNTPLTVSDFGFTFTFPGAEKNGNPVEVIRFVGVTPNPVSGDAVGSTSYSVAAGSGNTVFNGDYKALSIPPDITGLSATSGCPGAAIQITGTGFTGATAVDFGGISAGYIVDSDVQITATIPLGTGTVYVNVFTPIGTDNSNPVQFTFNAAPMVNAGSDTTGCGTTPMTLNGNFTGATGVNWTSSGTGTFNNATLPGATYTPSGADVTGGSVTLTLTTIGAACGPNILDQLLLTLPTPPAPPAVAGAPYTICNGSPANMTVTTFTGNPGWFTAPTGGTTVCGSCVNYSPSPTVNTTYYVEDVVSGCPSPTRTAVLVNVHNPLSPGAPSGNNSVCIGATNEAYSIIALATGTIYSWTPSPGAVITSGGTTNSILVDYPGGSANGSLIVTVTNACGSTPSSLPITVNPVVTPIININQTVGTNPICAGANAIFTATIGGGGPAPVYQWRINGSAVGTNSPSFTSTTLANGDVVSCDLTSNAPCVTTATVSSNNITMTVNPAPSNVVGVSPLVDTVCNGLDGLIIISPSQLSVNYQAFAGATPVSTVQAGNGTALNLTINNASLAAGTNNITIDATNSCGTFTLVSGAIIRKSTIVPPSLSYSGGVTLLCAGSPLSLLASGGPYAAQQWYFSSGSVIIGEVSMTYFPVTPANYEIEVTDNLCSLRSASINVSSAAGPDPVIVPGGLAPYDTVLSVPSGASYYQWYVGGKAIYGANSNTYRAYYNEAYQVAISINNCRLVSMPFTLSNPNFMTLVKKNFMSNDSMIFILPPVERDISLYPNPAEDAFNVDYKTSGTGTVIIELYNSMGSRALSKVINTHSGYISERFEGLGLPSGIYLLHVIEGEKTLVRNIQIN
ncbi:MAG: T9SS type A sorting domain-containing protein [Cytophagaceae bacterium]|nr:T9SS type A sorting domain-containing protein [Cytophagaceae bacterium]